MKSILRLRTVVSTPSQSVWASASAQNSTYGSIVTRRDVFSSDSAGDKSADRLTRYGEIGRSAWASRHTPVQRGFYDFGIEHPYLEPERYGGLVVQSDKAILFKVKVGQITRRLRQKLANTNKRRITSTVRSPSSHTVVSRYTKLAICLWTWPAWPPQQRRCLCPVHTLLHLPQVLRLGFRNELPKLSVRERRTHCDGI